MAITAQFLADFSDFVRGTQEAIGALTNFEEQSRKVGEAYEAAFKKLDFGNLLKDPFTELGRAADTFVEKLGPVAQGTWDVSKAIVGMALDAANTAAHLSDLSDKTGLSVPALSRLSNAAIVAGTDVDALSNVIFTMQKRMTGEQSDQFAAGLKQIGLEFSSFMAMNPDQQLLAIADGLKAQTDPLVRIQAGNAVLGTQYREMGPALLDLAEAQKQVADIKPFTKEQADAADKMNANIALLKLNFQGLKDTIGLTAIPAINAFFDALKDPDGVMAGFIAAHDKVKTSLSFMNIDLQTLGGTYDNTLPKVAGLDEMNQKLVASTAALHPPMVSVNEALLAQGAMATEDAATLRALEAEEKKMATAMEELDAAGRGWQGTLAGLNGDMVGAIQYYLEAGVSQGTLATAYGLTAVQVRAVATAMVEEQTRLKELKELEAARTTALQDLALEYDKILRASDRSTQGQITNAWRAADAQIMAMAKAGTFTEEAYAQIQRNAHATIDNIIAKTLEQEVGTKSYYERLATQAREAYTFAQAHAEEYSLKHMEILRQEAETAEATLLNWQNAAETALGGVKGAAEQAGLAMDKVVEGARAATEETYKLGRAMLEVDKQAELSPMQKQRGHYESQRALIDAYGAAGIPINISNIGGAARASSGIKGGYAPSYPVSITINGTVLGNKDEIARVVGDAMTHHYGRGGNRFPV